MKNKKLYRVNEGKMISGVCMGISEYLDIDVTLIRLLWVILSCVYGSGLLIYILATIIMHINPPIKKVN